MLYVTHPHEIVNAKNTIVALSVSNPIDAIHLNKSASTKVIVLNGTAIATAPHRSMAIFVNSR